MKILHYSTQCRKLDPEIESVFLLTTPEHTMVTSTIVRDIIRHGGNALQFLPNIDNKEAYLRGD